MAAELAARERSLAEAQSRLDRQAAQSQAIVGKIAEQQGALQAQQGSFKTRERQLEEAVRCDSVQGGTPGDDCCLGCDGCLAAVAQQGG